MLGEKLKFLLIKDNLTQKELSYYLQVSPTAVSHWLNNDRKPPFEILNKIARYFGVTTDYLIDDRIPVEQIQYMMFSGDKLFNVMKKLAEAENVTLDEVRKWMNIPDAEYERIKSGKQIERIKIIDFLNNLQTNRPHWAWALGSGSIDLYLKKNDATISIDQVGRGLSPKIPIENELSPSDLTLIQEIIEIVLEYLNIPKSDKIALLVKYIYEEIKEQEREISEDELKKKVLKLVKIAV